jgi:quercetin dioxygenase-like cupin family protein
MIEESSPKLYTLAQDEGQVLWFLGAPILVKATGEQTGGTFGLVEHLLPPGDEAPYHIHHREDEIFYVLEGELTFFSGEQQFTCGPGSYTFLPRDIPHGFRVSNDGPARLLILTVPAGFEQFVIELSEPTPPTEPPDMDRFVALAPKYGIEVLGNLPASN